MNNKIEFLIMLIVTFVTTLLLIKRLINVFSKRKIGQKILEIGPSWHKNKNGTPTMGGLSFVIAFILTFFVYLIMLLVSGRNEEIFPVLIVVIFVLINAFVGIIDDLSKIKKDKNEGLKPLSKLLFQGISAILLLAGLTLTHKINTILKIPFLDVEYDIGFFYYFIGFFVICGFINATNLTDGIDGLASSVSLTSGVLISAISMIYTTVEGLGFVGATIIGVTFAFLFFNLHPAKIFMGDTGSLFLGSLIVCASFLINNPLLILLYGFIFLCEAISVILQVTIFRITKGKRLFKMAPLHHHLEKSGFSEMKIVVTFTLINSAFCILAYVSLLNL